MVGQCPFCWGHFITPKFQTGGMSGLPIPPLRGGFRPEDLICSPICGLQVMASSRAKIGMLGPLGFMMKNSKVKISGGTEGKEICAGVKQKNCLQNELTRLRPGLKDAQSWG